MNAQQPRPRLRFLRSDALLLALWTLLSACAGIDTRTDPDAPASTDATTLDANADADADTQGRNAEREADASARSPARCPPGKRCESPTCGPRPSDFTDVRSGSDVGSFRAAQVQRAATPQGLLRWREDLPQPNNVEGTPWCSGVLLSPDLLLTAAHCLSADEHWIPPPGVDTPEDFCQSMEVDFTFERPQPMRLVVARCREVVSLAPNGLDIALLRLVGAPGDVLGWVQLTEGVRVGDEVLIISNPLGMPKVASHGSVLRVAGGVQRDLCPSDFGSSGAPVFGLDGYVHAVRTAGSPSGCIAPLGTPITESVIVQRSNIAVTANAVLAALPWLRSLAPPPGPRDPGDAGATCDGGTQCGGACIDASTHPLHCGRCDNACPAGNTCVRGRCEQSCAPPRAACGGRCVDTRSDPSHCGACGRACSASSGQVTWCTNGACESSCAAWRADCDGSLANGCEVDLRADTGNCGRCGQACSTLNGEPGCAQGTCRVGRCSPNFADCNLSSRDGCEVNLLSDILGCGACGHRCAGSQRCMAGACR
jgi:Trypsin-like peptidase domain/Stigma-specific protein, Stig1